MSVCVSCHNGVADGNETDVDCGGDKCKSKCAFGMRCDKDKDCGTEECNTTAVPPVCSASQKL